MAYGIFRRRPRIVPKTSNQVYYMTSTKQPPRIDTYISYISAMKWLTVYVDNVEVARFKADGSTSIQGLLDSLAGRKVNVIRVTSDTTLNTSHHHVYCDTDSNNINITLPALINKTQYIIYNCGSSGNVVTLIPDGTDLLLGENSNYDIYDGGDEQLTAEATEGWR